MNIQQYIITDRVSLTVLPNTYTFKIDGNIYEADWEEPYGSDEMDTMIEAALDQIALEFGECSDDEEFEVFLIPLRNLHNLLLPDSPID